VAKINIVLPDSFLKSETCYSKPFDFLVERSVTLVTTNFTILRRIKQETEGKHRRTLLTIRNNRYLRKAISMINPKHIR